MGYFDNLSEHTLDTDNPPPAARPKKKPINDRYVAVTLTELTSGRLDTVFSAKARLYLVLGILSVRGSREVHLTAAVCDAIRLARNLKSRYLREFVEDGAIAVRGGSGRAPWVVVLRLP